MKVLKVSGEDYAALSFGDEHDGTPVKDVIAKPDNFLPSDDSEGYWELKVFEFEGEIDQKFVDFIRNHMIDYDTSKHEGFYMEHETVKR